MRSFLAILIFLISFSVFADELKVEISPAKPVAGEVFQAYFRIFTSADEEPAINFNPANVEVVGKSNQGVSTRTVYANGKLTVTREITIVYDLVSEKPGFASLREITAQLGAKTIRHATISLNVLKEPEALADVFVMADVPKKELFLGEGLVVRYYLYSKVPISNLDVKKYPKLNNFLKRYLQEPERTERVSVDGQLYMRNYIYAAKLYPEKVGELKIDTLELSATYPGSRANDPFGAFGLSRDFKTKTIRSETVKVNVRPLPEPIPSHFTGLVGKHDFHLQFGQSKLIVNEPLEVKLTVSGVGALENLEAPNLIKNPGLEEFETNGDLKISDADNATKTFDYTFLAKENMSIPAKEIVLSYFDPDTNKYVPSQISLPEITIAGGTTKEKKPENPITKQPTKTKTEIETKQPITKDLASPLTSETWEWKRWLPIFNSSLAIIAVLISLLWIIREKKLPSFHMSKNIPSSFRKGQFELSEFVQWMTPLIKKTGKSPVAIIRESPMDEDSKRYFIDLLQANDYKDYSSRKTEMKFKYQSGSFKELARYIESVSNGNTSQPS
jgi:hypothetical protein